MNKNLMILLVIVALLVTALIPSPYTQKNVVVQAQAGTLDLVINNKTGEKFNLVMKGPSTYNLMIKAGKQTVKILPGKYKYTYKACGGEEKKGTLEFKKNNQVLVLAVCKVKQAAGGMVNITVQNNTHGYMTLNLVGPATYRFSLKAGKNTITVAKGKYQYTATGCGGSVATGKIQLKKPRVWTWFCR